MLQKECNIAAFDEHSHRIKGCLKTKSIWIFPRAVRRANWEVLSENIFGKLSRALWYNALIGKHDHRQLLNQGGRLNTRKRQNWSDSNRNAWLERSGEWRTAARIGSHKPRGDRPRMQSHCMHFQIWFWQYGKNNWFYEPGMCVCGCMPDTTMTIGCTKEGFL